MLATLLDREKAGCMGAQAHSAVEGAREALGRYEAALAARGARLADSWRAMREAADRLLAGDACTPDTGLQVSSWSSVKFTLHVQYGILREIHR